MLYATQFSQLPRSHCDRGAVGDRLWCIALLLTNAPAVARNGKKIDKQPVSCPDFSNYAGVSTTDNCNTTESSLYHIFSHAALLDLLSCLNDNGYPHPRTARAIDSWFQFRTGRLNSKDVISNAPIPLLHREFQECVFPIMNDMTFSILNGVYSSDVHNDVNSYVVEFAISADSPREHTWAWEIAASADTAVRIVDKLIRAAFHAPNENKFKIQSNRLWRLVFALYAAMTQSCEYRYKEPITTVKLPGESTHKACPWTVHVMCESPFELIEWDGVPFRTLLQFLVHQYLCINDSASLARGIMTDIVSMALRLCPEVLLTDTVSTPQRPTKLHTKGSGCAETNISAIDKKDVLFNIFFRYGSSSFTSYTLQMGFDIVSTSVVLDLLKDVLLKAYEISSLGVLCCRNILCFSQHCDAATSKLEVETSVAQQNAFILNLDWEIIWSHIYSMHPAPLLLQLETLNCLIDADKFRLEIEMEPRRSDGTEAEIEGKIYNNMKYSTYSGLFGVELAERTFSAADIISCSRHVAPSQRSFRLFTKEPISLLRLLSAYMLVTCQFARVLLFKLVADQLLASRILARRSIWSMTAAYWLNPIGVDVQSSPGCITPWRRSEDMQAQFIDMQEVIAARLMIEISCSSAYRSGVYEHDRGATTIHQLLVRNASLLPLLMFYFDDFSSEQHAIVMMRSDRALLHQWGAQLFYVMAQQVHGLDHTDRSNGGDVRSGSPHAFLDQIIEIKRLSLGPISWSVNFLHLLFLYFVEISEDIQKEKLGHNRLCTNQCDALCSMLGAFLFKCISTFNCYHEPELFLHATSRVFEAMVTARPEMAGNPLLVMNELHSIRFLGTGVRAFSDYHRGVIENVIQGYPSHLSDITYVAKTERVYELFLIVKSILSDNLACLQQVLHEGVHGEIQDLSWSAFQKNRAAMKKRKVTDIGLEQRKRARSLDIAGDIDDCSNIGSHADSSDSGSESDNGYSSTGSSDDTEEEEPENCLGPKVAIIVPFRDLHTAQKRSEHLKRFVPEMSQFLSTRNFVIYIIEQSDDKKEFNRGALLNTGFKIAAAEDADIFIFHDVDLMPSAELLSFYTTIPTGKSPVHIARVWNRYNGNDKYFGGIVAFSKTQYEDMNGYPNNFWGWGGEDDELMKRAQEVFSVPCWCFILR